MIEQIEYVPVGYKKWYSDLMGITYVVREKSCFFCQHCTDVFLDYTHGPYMIICDIQADDEKGYAGICSEFKEE